MPPLPQSGFVFCNLPSEVRLLLVCCRWPFEDGDAACARSLCVGTLDWDRFLALCIHHRVVPLVHRALRGAELDPPARVVDALKRSATQNAVGTLQYLAETRRLCDLLQDAGLAVRVLKGVPLSQRIFGDPSLRSVGDIDLLIAPGMEESADRILLIDGFRRDDPSAPLTARRRRSWRRHGKDYTYRADRAGFEIDLHWRLFRNPHMPGNALADGGEAAIEQMQLGATSLAVLPIERSFLYLCVHGALDGWLRYKSLVDVAALWRRFSEDQRQSAAEMAQRHHVLPELAAALCLTQQLELCTADAVAPPMQLQSDGREAQWILRYAATQQRTQQYLPTQEAVGSWALKRYELGLRRGFAYRFEVFRRVLMRPRVWARFHLPDSLFPLYAALSPLEWLMFHRGSVAVPPRPARHTRWKRWRALASRDRSLLLEAFVHLLLARGALLLLPVRRIFRWLEEPLHGAERPNTSVTPERIRWAILTVARHGPLSFVCFPQALAAHAMLRRRGISSVMHYGVRRAADRTLRAHTWLEVDQRMLLGGESAVLFAPIHSTASRNRS